jgi:DNA-binding transcriptional LysR family regulator
VRDDAGVSKGQEPLVPAPLRYFLAIAEHGSFTAAARAVRMSQPALTAAIRQLEEDLGTTLFLRTARGAVPTRTGETLVVHARGLVRAAGELRASISELEHEARGRFVLGCHESLGAYFLPGFMPRFFEAHPRIEIALWNGNSRDVMSAVIDRRLDVGIVVNPTPHPDCVIVPLFADRVAPIAHARLVARRARSPLALLDEVPLLYVPVLSQVQWILARLPPGDGRRRHLPCSSMELVKSLVLDGAGVGILPARVAAHGAPPGTLVGLGPDAPGFDDQVALVRRADLHETRAARLLLDALRARGRELAEKVGGPGLGEPLKEPASRSRDRRAAPDRSGSGRRRPSPR